MPGEQVAGSFSFLPKSCCSSLVRWQALFQELVPHPSLCLRWTDSLDQLSPVCGHSSIRDVKKHSLDNRNTKGSDIKDRYEANLSHVHPHKKDTCLTLIQPPQLQVENISHETPIKSCVSKAQSLEDVTLCTSYKPAGDKSPRQQHSGGTCGISCVTDSWHNNHRLFYKLTRDGEVS